MINTELDKLIEKATIDCYDEYEQRLGFCCMLQDELIVPFPAKIIGEDIIVTELDQDDDDQMIALCQRHGKTFSVHLLDLEIDDKKVTGSQWLSAYRRWFQDI